MKLIFIGPPGAGKGTQAVLVSKEFNISHISTGDLLRQAVKEKTAVGLRAEIYIKKGELVPDEIVTEITAERLEKPDCQNGFILDGYPRTLTQAQSLDSSLTALKLNIDAVIYFKTSTKIIIQRLSGRRICRQCGANYHMVNMPPQKEGRCDNCGGELYQRDDDQEKTILNRLHVYERQSANLIDYYQKKNILKEISGDLEASIIFNLLLKMFKPIKQV